MARPAKSTALRVHKDSKETKAARLEIETRLKGGTNKLKPPDYLTVSQVKIFKFLIKELEASNILGNLDVYVLAKAAVTIDRMQEAERYLNEHGLLDEYTGRKSSMIEVKNSYTADFFKICQELCLSPQARAKVAGANLKAKQDSSDPLLKAINGGDY